jgi:Flp pilus assembly protein TadD
MKARLFRLAALAAAVTVSLGTLGAAAQNPNDPLALVKQARKVNLEGKQDEAIALYREALMRAPDSYDAYYGLGIALDLKGSFAEARDAFVKAIQLAPEDSKDQALGAIAV